MVIRELSREECLALLAESRLSRLACVHDDQPYIVPAYLAYDAEAHGEPSLYGVTTRGTKVEWMRSNPRVCVEVDHVLDFDQWVSVVVLGRYEELVDAPREEVDISPAYEQQQALRRHSAADDPGNNPERHRAFQILQSHAMWWEPAWSAWRSRGARSSGESLDPVYYRICIESVSGHRAVPEGGDVSPPPSSNPNPTRGWLRGLFGLR